MKKICYKCGDEKDLELDYYKNYNYCKSCKNLATRMRRSVAAKHPTIPKKESIIGVVMKDNLFDDIKKAFFVYVKKHPHIKWSQYMRLVIRAGIENLY